MRTLINQKFEHEPMLCKQTLSITLFMPPTGLSQPFFESIIRTRSNNKDKHPGDDHVNKYKQVRRTQAEMKDVREKEAQDEVDAAENWQAALAQVARIEDAQRLEDIERSHNSTSHRRQPGVASFKARMVHTDESQSSAAMTANTYKSNKFFC